MGSENRITTSVGSIAASKKNALVGGPFGSNLVSADYTPVGIPVIRGQNMGYGRWVDGKFAHVSPEKSDTLSANIAHPGDIVFTQRGTLGQVAIVPKSPYDRYVISQSQMKITVDKEKVDSLFVYYIFTSNEQQEYIRQNSIQTGVPHTNLGILRETPIDLPPLPEQKAIAHILGTLDDMIELNRKMNETLEGMARALFKSWFVDFDPVRIKAEAKAKRKSPDAALKALGLSPEIAALFPDEFQNSELGKIPKGWEVVALQELSDLGWGDTSVTKKSYTEVGFTAYSAKGADGFLPYHDYNREGIVVSAIGANAGATWLASGKWSCIKNTIRFWATDDQISTEYLYHATKGNDKWPLRGSAQPFIAQGDARNMRVLLPGNCVGVKFGEIVRHNYDCIRANNRNGIVLSSIRDTLLPKLLSGEITVS